MYKVPNHIKLHLDRIVREYDKLHQQGHKISLQIFQDGHLYSGQETTEYWLNSAKTFRNLLDNPNNAFFSGTEQEIRRNIYIKICEFYKPLSEKAILRITHTTECQEQLERALRAAKKAPSLSSDANNISWFISNGCTLNWCELDKSVEHKIFKLVRSEDAFEKLLIPQPNPKAIEITQAGTTHYNHFRIAFQKVDIETAYRNQSRIREFKNFWNTSHDIEYFDMDYKIFNMWNNITETGIYYIFIPQK